MPLVDPDLVINANYVNQIDEKEIIKAIESTAISRE